jgi:hypothetical protein
VSAQRFLRAYASAAASASQRDSASVYDVQAAGQAVMLAPAPTVALAKSALPQAV